MKELLVLRHAKSSWEDASLADIDRPLSERGLDAAPLMGREIAARGWAPALALVSPARRARHTWELVAAGLEAPPPASIEERLYMASPDEHLELVRRNPEDLSCVIVVGHNPGLGAFAAALWGPDSESGARGYLAKKYPTAALARFTFEGAWAGLGFGAAGLSHFLRPKDLARPAVEP